MSGSLWIMVLILGFLPMSVVQSRHISPRALPGFAKMIKTTTGREALEYNLYGNYCGLGGSGEPVDDTDGCCRMHDHCYDELLKLSGCVPYFNVYKAHYNGSTVICVETGDYCSDGACKCDNEAATCFAMANYNPANRRFRMLRDFGAN